MIKVILLTFITIIKIRINFGIINFVAIKLYPIKWDLQY
jgi:hypothetical protein